MQDRPTFSDVLTARVTIAPYIRPTPLYHYPALDQLVGAQVYVKHEDYQLIRAFKIRGGINLLAHLSPPERARGVITASTGNHGQSIAYAARHFGIRAIIVVPEGANPGKVEAIRNLDVEVRFHGREFDDAREFAEQEARERGYRYIHPANEPLLISGVGTYALEILEELPDVEAILVPLGGGSGACGCCIVAKAVNPAIRVIAVQAEEAPAAYLSWKAGKIVEAPNRTAAEGMATRTGFELTQRILRELLDDFVLVSEEAIRQAIFLYLERARILAEGAGAAPLAAALKLKEQLQGKKVALVLSGGNISPAQLHEVLEAYGSRRTPLV